MIDARCLATALLLFLTAAQGDQTAYMPAWDEEEESMANKDLPTKFRCDGCRGVAFQLASAFAQAEARISTTGAELPESEFFDAIENTCQKGLEGKCGVKAKG